MKLIPSICAAALLALAPIARAEEEPKESPTAVVEKIQATLIQAMKEGEKLGLEGRVKLIDAVARETHSFETISRIALGKNWKPLTEEQRKAFVDRFSELGVVTYASNFSSFHDEAFKTVSEKAAERGQTLVKSTLTTGDGREVQFNYVLEKKGGAWRIVNIIVDGVSDLALKRSEYEGIIAAEGFDGLMKKLDQKIADLRAAGPEKK